MKYESLHGLRVLVTVTNPLFHDRRMIRICSALSEQGAEVKLIGVYKKNAPEPGTQPFAQHRFRLWFKKGPGFYANYNIRLLWYLLRVPFDLLISVDLDTLPAGSLACSLKGKKKIYDAHEYFTDVPEVVHRPFVKWLWSWIAKTGIGNYNMTVSDSLASVLEKRYGHPFSVIRNMPEKSESATKPVKRLPETDAIELLYIGYLNEGRGLESLIQAMTLLPYRFRLTLAGSGDLDASLQQQASALGLNTRISFTGWVLPDKLDRYLEKAHIGLNLLEAGSPSYYYSLANKTFDYYRYGIPAIHMDFPEYRSLQEQYGGVVLLPGLDPATLAKTLEKLATDRKTYHTLSSQCLSASAILNWDSEKKKLLDFLVDCID